MTDNMSKMLSENWYVNANKKEQKLFREWTLGLLREPQGDDLYTERRYVTTTKGT